MTEFIWFFSDSGVQVQNLKFDDNSDNRQVTPWIFPADPPDGATRHWRQYAPLRNHHALCRTFADIDLSQASIVDFANKYGQLTDPDRGESLATWVTSIRDMRSAVACWDEAQNADVVPSIPSRAGIGDTPDDFFSPGSFAKGIWCKSDQDVDRVSAIPPKAGSDDTGVEFFPMGSFAKGTRIKSDDYLNLVSVSQFGFDRICDRPHGGENFGFDRICDRPHGGENRSEVLVFLATKINQYTSNVRTVYECARQDTLTDRTSDWDASNQAQYRLFRRARPATLLEAMWVQFGQAIEYNKSFCQCRQCGTWFDRTPKAARVDKVFCTEACKAKAYRKRLAAQRLAGLEGLK